MTRLLLSLLLFTCCLASPAALCKPATQTQEKQSPQKSIHSFKVGFIRDSNLTEGCGCGFTLPAELRKKAPHFIFTSNDEDMNKAWMNIDGKDVELDLIQSNNPSNLEKVGSRSTRTYARSGIRIYASYIATRVCRSDDESCESNDYIGTFTVTEGRQKSVLRLNGSCGC